MTIGVGGSSAEEALSQLTLITAGVQPIKNSEYLQRIQYAQRLMKQHNMVAIYVNAGTNLTYFTGMQWHASERLVGAIIPVRGDIHYIAPHFEIDTLRSLMVIDGPVSRWHEHENPYQEVLNTLSSLGVNSGQIGIDESTAFFIYDGLRQVASSFEFVNAKPVTAGCRMHKSQHELALIQTAKAMTLAVHKAAAKILYAGISTEQVTDFIHQAHQKVGASGSSFCIVLFGTDTAFPHGVKSPKTLEDNEIVLIDTGCLVQGYHSDITRTYVFGSANEKQRKLWAIEKQAQAIAFAKAQLGITCGEVDSSVREYLHSQGLGPNYQLPGLPHRTGHGIGMDIHEWPYLVSNDQTALAPGMCFSNEPMLVIPNEFGVRLEDHFYMTEEGPQWFTIPSHSIDDPFGYNEPTV